MRNFFVRAVVVLIVVGGASLAFAYSSGPPASKTGAFQVQNKTAEPTCRQCHSANTDGIPSGINDPSGLLRILDVPANYTPGQTYTLRVHLEHTWDPVPATPLRWGFQLQAVQASTGDGVGTWILGANSPPDTFKIVQGLSTSVWKNRRYIEHTRDLADDTETHASTHWGELGPVEWHVDWQAPPGDSGKIYFFAAGNSANGDDVSFQSGDFIFTTAESTMGSSNVDVAPHPEPLRLRTALAPPYPNPMVKCTDVSFTIPTAGVVDIAIFDTQGRLVRSLLHEFRVAGSHGWFWDGRRDDRTYARNGVYFIRLTAPDGRRVAQKVVLAR
ncbi:MAG TPA: choice-of-anchor V domain-containing protein [Candidatus Eisenbacteria bacterium]|jgi:hypothetical protein